MSITTLSQHELFKQIADGTYEGFADVPDTLYNQDQKYYRNSWNNALSKSPAHLAYERANPKESSHFAFGRALHYRLQSRDAFNAHVFVSLRTDGRTKEGKDYRARLPDLSQGRTILSQEEADEIETIAQKIEADREVAPALQGGVAELAGFFTEPFTQVPCKIKMDLWRPDALAIIDFKSTDDAGSIDDIEKKIYNFGYHRQAAMYCLGASLLTGQPVNDFICMFIEKKPPYEFRLIRINDAAREQGLQEYRENLAKFKRCVRDNLWPGYPRHIEEAGIPHWAWKG